VADLTATQLVPRVRDLLGDTPSVLTSTTTGTGTSITLSDASTMSEGDILEWQTGAVGYEQMLVTNANGGVNPITVVRGVNGTTAESHTSGDSLFVNPSFTGRQTQQAISAGVRKLWPYCYIVTSCDLGAPSTNVWYNIVGAPAETMGLVDVRQQFGTAPALYQGDYVLYGSRGGLPVMYDLTLDTSIVATGFGIRFPSGFYHPTNHPFARVASPITGTAADIPDSGKWPVADAVAYFAAGRMTGALEIPRVSTGGDLESSTTVGTGARTSAGSDWMSAYQQLLQTLGIRFRNFYKPLDVQ
jgi:hypothetical protein